jgi:repressor LexA
VRILIDRDLPLKKEISENIKKLMKRNNWTQLRTSEKSGISKSTLSDYINCKTLINPGNVEKLAEAFKVSKGDIDPSFNQNPVDISYNYDSAKAGNFTVKENSSPYYVKDVGFQKVPIVGTISCGEGILAYEDIEGYEDVPKSWMNGVEHFFLRAKGDSMINARIHDGDMLLIRVQDQVENGEIAAVQIDGEEAVLKRVYITDDTMILQSENPKYPPIIARKGQDIKILGKLKRNFIEY